METAGVAAAGGLAAVDDGAAVLFDLLPDELLLHIFTFVGSRWVMSRVHAVCRRWRSVSSSVMVGLSRGGVFSDDVMPFTAALFRSTTDANAKARWFCDLVGRFRIVKVHGGVFHGMSGVACCKALSACGGAVTSFDIERNFEPFFGSVCRALGTHCPRLKALCMDNVDSFDSKLGSVKLLFEQCSEIDDVQIYDSSSCEDDFLCAMARGLAKSKRLTTFRIWEDIGGVFTDMGLICIATACPNLMDFCVQSTMMSVGDPTLFALAESCANLTRVCFSDGWGGASLGVSDTGMVALATKCAQLTTVQCDGSELVTDATLAALAASCPRLVNISMSRSGITDDGVCDFARKVPGLLRVHFNDTSVGDGGVFALLTSCAGLCEIGFSWSDITDAALEYIFAHGRSLRGVDGTMLNDGRPDGVTDAGVKLLEAHSEAMGGILDEMCGDASNTVFS